MSDLLAQVERTIRLRHLFRRGQPILVGVSGGLDSMVLLEALHELASENGWQLTLAHLNHQLRGRSSDADERLVRSRAAKLGLAAVIERADVRQFARARGLSIEMAARKVRHDFLARIAAQSEIGAIALGHHSDDQIETFFLRLLRGSGGEAIAGMKWSNPSPSNPEIRLVRPLLDLPKSALADFAAERRVRFREDASNAAQDIQRNRIRHELLPLLRKKYQPALDKTVLRLMDVVGTETEFVTELARHWLQKRRKEGGHALRTAKGVRILAASPFEQLPVAVQRRCVHLQLLQLGVMPNYDLIENLRSHPSRQIAISRENVSGISSVSSGGFSATRFYLIRDPSGMVSLQESERVQFRSGAQEVNLGGRTGEIVFDGSRIRWHFREQSGAGDLSRVSGREWFDADKVGSRILLRHWEAGDRFQPIGMAQPVKLQDFFTNQKVLREVRHELILAVSEAGEVFWVEGQRISENFRVTPRTIRRLQWEWQRV